jgi:hypothetical protein
VECLYNIPSKILIKLLNVKELLSFEKFLFSNKLSISSIKKIVFLFGYGTSTKNKLIPYCKKNNIELIYS